MHHFKQVYIADAMSADDNSSVRCQLCSIELYSGKEGEKITSSGVQVVGLVLRSKHGEGEQF
jgi:hypothetical protein